MQTVWANVHVHVERVCASASPGHRPGCHFRPGPTANDVERQALGAVFRKFLLPTQQGRLSQVPCSGVNFFLFFFSDNSDYHFWEAASAEEGGSCISRRVAFFSFRPARACAVVALTTTSRNASWKVTLRSCQSIARLAERESKSELPESLGYVVEALCRQMWRKNHPDPHGVSLYEEVRSLLPRWNEVNLSLLPKSTDE